MSDLLSSGDNCQIEGNEVNREVFLLTKPPHSERTALCFRLIEQSKNAVLYLAGDGVYNLMSPLRVLPTNSIYACREDMEARGVHSIDAATSPDDFYDQLVKYMMFQSDRVYFF